MIVLLLIIVAMIVIVLLVLLLLFVAMIVLLLIIVAMIVIVLLVSFFQLCVPLLPSHLSNLREPQKSSLFWSIRQASVFVKVDQNYNKYWEGNAVDGQVQTKLF